MDKIDFEQMVTTSLRMWESSMSFQLKLQRQNGFNPSSLIASKALENFTVSFCSIHSTCNGIVQAWLTKASLKLGPPI